MTEDDKEKSPDQLVATRLSRELADQVKLAAQQELVSTSAFIRRALASAVREQRKA